MFADVEKRAICANPQRATAAHLGLFATSQIPSGTIIVPKWHEDFYVGMDGWQFLEVDVILELPSAQRDLFFRYGLDTGFQQIVGPVEERYVTTLDNFINHACEPNLTYDHQGNVITGRTIDSDEQLTIDYGCFTVNFDEEFECECGSPGCRGRVKKDDWRMLAARYGYAMPRFLHPYIQELMAAK